MGLSPGRPSLHVASGRASTTWLLAVHLLKSQRPRQAHSQAPWPCGCKAASIPDGGGEEDCYHQLHMPAKGEAEGRPFCASHSVSMPVPWHPGPFACARNVLIRQRYPFPGSQTLLRHKHLLISQLQSLSSVILEPMKIKSAALSSFSPSICQKVIPLRPRFLICKVDRTQPTIQSRGKNHSSCLNYSQGSSVVIIHRLLFALRGFPVGTKYNMSTSYQKYLVPVSKTLCSIAGDLGSIPGQGTRSHMQLLRPSAAK